MNFSKDIKRFTNKVEDQADKITRMSFIQLSTNVIRRSPVDRGRFRANWQATINSSNISAIDTDDEPETNAHVASESVEAAAKNKKVNRYYLLNNLPYATVLEQGSSRQAPNGIVKLATLEWKSIVKMVTRMVK